MKVHRGHGGAREDTEAINRLADLRFSNWRLGLLMIFWSTILAKELRGLAL